MELSELRAQATHLLTELDACLHERANEFGELREAGVSKRIIERLYPFETRNYAAGIVRVFPQPAQRAQLLVHQRRHSFEARLIPYLPPSRRARLSQISAQQERAYMALATDEERTEASLLTGLALARRVLAEVACEPFGIEDHYAQNDLDWLQNNLLPFMLERTAKLLRIVQQPERLSLLS